MRQGQGAGPADGPADGQGPQVGQRSGRGFGRGRDMGPAGGGTAIGMVADRVGTVRQGAATGIGAKGPQQDHQACPSALATTSRTSGDWAWRATCSRASVIRVSSGAT